MIFISGAAQVAPSCPIFHFWPGQVPGLPAFGNPMPPVIDIDEIFRDDRTKPVAERSLP